MQSNAKQASRPLKSNSYLDWVQQNRSAHIKKLWDSKLLLAAGQVKGNKPTAKRVLNLALVLCEDLGMLHRHYKTLCSEDPDRDDRPLWKSLIRYCIEYYEA
jgi:hypothetical protein